eukprot:s176_g19.t1
MAVRPYVGSSHALHFASPSVACFMARLFIELTQAADLELCGQVLSCGVLETVPPIFPTCQEVSRFQQRCHASPSSLVSSSSSVSSASSGCPITISGAGPDQHIASAGSCGVAGPSQTASALGLDPTAIS